MSNFTDFFPAAGGGGGIGKTITIGDYAYPNERPLAEIAENRIALYGTDYNSVRVYAPSGSSPYNYTSGALPSDNTYVTIADITGATDGGAFTGVGGWARGTGAYAFNSFTVRITLDGGTPVEYTFDPQTYTQKSYCFAMGNFEIKGASVTYGTSSNLYYTSADSNLLGGYNTGFYGSGGGNSFPSTVLYILDPLICLYKGMPWIYFSNSCKVEIKMSATDFNTGNSHAAILTF